MHLAIEVELLRMPGKSLVCVTLSHANAECAH